MKDHIRGFTVDAVHVEEDRAEIKAHISMRPASPPQHPGGAPAHLQARVQDPSLTGESVVAEVVATSSPRKKEEKASDGSKEWGSGLKPGDFVKWHNGTSWQHGHFKSVTLSSSGKRSALVGILERGWVVEMKVERLTLYADTFEVGEWVEWVSDGKVLQGRIEAFHRREDGTEYKAGVKVDGDVKTVYNPRKNLFRCEPPAPKEEPLQKR